MTATAFSNQHQYSHDSSVQQTSILPSPPFVEPSGNYIAISSATNNTQTLPYGYPSSTLPTSNTLTNNLDTGNHIDATTNLPISIAPNLFMQHLVINQEPRPQAAQKDPFGREILSLPIL
ncbi:1166_t:CDS:2 [Rhizophagus irregularis]|nr:1166_t:CDS:2 [Rhizophagus irregularis]